MDIFNSQWLINMMAKSSKAPQERLLSLFDILGDWLNAPNVQLSKAQLKATQNSSQALIAYCTTQAQACGAENPNMLAEHIVLIARNAAQLEIAQLGSNSLAHAKKAAHALILTQTQTGWGLVKSINFKPAVYGIAASLLVLISVAWLWLPDLLQNNYPKIALASSNSLANNKPVNNNSPKAKQSPKTTTPVSTSLTAQDAANMYAKYEQMRNGTCQFPEALQIPDKDKAIYLENVVGGKLPTDLTNLAIANSYLEKVRCNFTPMLMANSK